MPFVPSPNSQVFLPHLSRRAPNYRLGYPVFHFPTTTTYSALSSYPTVLLPLCEREYRHRFSILILDGALTRVVRQPFNPSHVNNYTGPFRKSKRGETFRRVRLFSSRCHATGAHSAPAVLRETTPFLHQDRYASQFYLAVSRLTTQDEKIATLTVVIGHGFTVTSWPSSQRVFERGSYCA